MLRRLLLQAGMVTAGCLRVLTHPRVILEPTPLENAHEFLSAVLASEGVELLILGRKWPLVEAICRQHDLVGNAISHAWIAAAVVASKDPLVTMDRDFVALLPRRQLMLLPA